jgi:uncharacterized protein YukE
LLLAESSGIAAREAQPLEANSLAKVYPFYHTSDTLVTEATTLVSGCDGLTVSMESDGGISLPVARLSALGKTSDGAPPLRVMMVFGEHARELISPEAGLQFLRKLCSSEGAETRHNTSFVMALNANPKGRQQVEAGSYCVRTNENEVDLNRNYGDHWQAEKESDDEVGVGAKRGQQFESFSSGSAAFSEPETRIIASILQKDQPDVFLDVHSGTRGLFMPYDWTTDPIPNEDDRNHMNAVLQEINERDCPECTVGGGAETVGYLAPGASADYAYAHGVKFSYIWEIYSDSETSQRDLQAHRLFLANKQQQNQKTPGTSFLARSSRAIRQPAALPSWASDVAGDLATMEKGSLDKCFQQFNPVTEDDYQSTVERWSNAFMHLCTAVQRLRSTTADSSDSAAPDPSNEDAHA